MAEARIEILDASVRVLSLEVRSRDVVEFLRAVPEPEREGMVIRAIEVGVFCLERAGTRRDLEFVRRQVESLLNEVQSAVAKVPEETQKSLASRIGTGEGQLLAPVQALVNDVSRAANEKIKEVRELLSQEMDPTKETTTLGKALRTIRDLLDPKRTDSIQGSLGAAINAVAAQDGTLARTVKEVVAESVKPLKDQVDSLAREVRGKEAAAEALEQTTLKGASYEEEVVGNLQAWAKGVGAEVHHVGGDNRPGDVLVKVRESALGPEGLTIVLEVRDRQTPMGRKAITDALNDAMAERGSGGAVYLSRARDGLAREIGDWAEGTCAHGPWIACTDEHLTTAVRFLVAQEGLARLRSAAPAVDSAAVQAQLGRVRTALGRVKTINTKATTVRTSADEIRAEAERLRDDIRGALTEIEGALRISLQGDVAEETGVSGPESVEPVDKGPAEGSL